jgi:hypothetical protein
MGEHRLFDDYGRPLAVLTPGDFVHRLVGGDLASDGVQWSDEVPTVAAGEDTVAFNLALDNDQKGSISCLTFGLTLAIKAGSATADVKYKWQARNKGGTWVDLHSYITIADVDTDYVERTMSGYLLSGVENMDSYPMDVRLLIQSNETTPGVATAKVKSSGFIIVELM